MMSHRWLALFVLLGVMVFPLPSVAQQDTMTVKMQYLVKESFRTEVEFDDSITVGFFDTAVCETGVFPSTTLFHTRTIKVQDIDHIADVEGMKIVDSGPQNPKVNGYLLTHEFDDVPLRDVVAVGVSSSPPATFFGINAEDDVFECEGGTDDGASCVADSDCASPGQCLEVNLNTLNCQLQFGAEYP